jgi:hypothetical protein
VIFDDNRLTQFLLKRSAEDASDQIAGAARRKGNNNFDGPLGKTRGARGNGQCRSKSNDDKTERGPKRLVRWRNRLEFEHRILPCVAGTDGSSSLSLSSHHGLASVFRLFL